MRIKNSQIDEMFIFKQTSSGSAAGGSAGGAAAGGAAAGAAVATAVAVGAAVAAAVAVVAAPVAVVNSNGARGNRIVKTIEYYTHKTVDTTPKYVKRVIKY